MANPLIEAIVKKTTKPVQVYRHHSGSFIDYSDCNTEYKEEDLILLETKKS